jgi:ribonuclease HI
MIIYTDGACSGNGSATAVGGFAAIVLDDEGNYIISHHEQVKNTTNNRMELSAILWSIAKYGQEKPCPTVYTDSAYCVNTLTSWMWGWEKRGWLKSDNKEPENLDLIQAYHTLWNRGYRIELRKCHGHSGDHWNEQADKLAVAAKEGAGQVTINLMKGNI